MNEESTKKLIEDFPELYWQYVECDIYQSAMPWGFDVGQGWFELLYELSEKLVPLVKQFNKDYPPKPEDMYYGFGVVQVKEKFGGLRYYTNYCSDEINDIITTYEELSYKTCEVCGKPGEVRGTGWYYTSCQEHAKEQDK